MGGILHQLKGRTRQRKGICSEQNAASASVLQGAQMTPEAPRSKCKSTQKAMQFCQHVSPPKASAVLVGELWSLRTCLLLPAFVLSALRRGQSPRRTACTAPGVLMSPAISKNLSIGPWRASAAWAVCANAQIGTTAHAKINSMDKKIHCLLLSKPQDLCDRQHQSMLLVHWIMRFSMVPVHRPIVSDCSAYIPSKQQGKQWSDDES